MTGSVKGFIEIKEKLGSMGGYQTLTINPRHIAVIYKISDGSCSIYLENCDIRIRTVETYEEVLEKIREAGWTL